jgi:competence protein ComEC
VFEAADAIRSRFREATAHLPADARGLVPALVIGDTSRSPADLTEAMLETGMSHLSAVSGSNVTLVLAAGLGLCQLVLVPRRLRPWIALAVLLGFVILARPEPSVIRAAVMGTVGLLGLSTSRRQAGIPALSGAVLALLVWDPWLSRSYGFALSTVATLGLLVLAQPWGAAISRRLHPRLSWLGPVVAVPVAAQAVCAPLVVPLQGSVSLIAVPANLLAAPLVGPTTIAGVAAALISVVWVGGAALVAWLAALPALGIARVARMCAEVPYGNFGWVSPLGPQWPWLRSRWSPSASFRGRAISRGCARSSLRRSRCSPPLSPSRRRRSPGRHRGGSSSPAMSGRVMVWSSTTATAERSSSTRALTRP